MDRDSAIVTEKKRFFHYPDSHVTPLVEIFSVSIQSDNQSLINDDDKPCQIYGRVRVIDRLEETFDLFNRNKDEAEPIYLTRGGGSLLLTAPLDPQHALIIPSDHLTLDVSLFNTAFDDLPIVKDEITLDRIGTTNELDEDYRVDHLKGNHGFSGRLDYAVFPFAVVANVTVLFFSKDDDFDTPKRIEDESTVEYYVGPFQKEEYDDDFWERDSDDERDIARYEMDECCIRANVYGTVAASFRGGNGNGNGNHSILFSKPIAGSLEVKSGGLIQLSRSVVAVPAYSPLKIEATLYDRDSQSPIASGSVEFKSRDDDIRYKKDIVGENGRIRVRVAWSHAYDQLNRASALKRVSELGPITPEVSESGGESRIESSKKKQKVLLEHQPLVALSTGYVKGVKMFPWPMFEVFSVVVNGEDKPFRFHGKIRVQDGDDHYIFNKGGSCLQDCPSSGAVLAVVGNGSHGFSMTNGFSITLDLKDDRGATISRGHIIWTDPYEFVDRRMCTLVRGDRGFAVVHYVMFPDGFSAALKVKVCGQSIFPGTMKGKLYARYANCDYSRSYEEKYFQSILFYDDNKGAEVPASGYHLPLVKSIVAVPKTTYLIIVADLSFSSQIDANAPQVAESLKGRLELRGGCVHSGKLGKDDLYLDISVEYSEFC